LLANISTYEISAFYYQGLFVPLPTYVSQFVYDIRLMVFENTPVPCIITILVYLKYCWKWS